MAIKIHHPHDSFIRRSLTSIQVARDLLKAHLAPDMTKRINWDTLQLTNKSFVKDELTQLHTDFHGLSSATRCVTKVRHESNERIRSLHAVSEMAEGPP